jgi:hypothetical protein
VAAWFPDVFYKFYLMKNHNIANNSTSVEVEQQQQSHIWISYHFSKNWGNLKTF